MSIICPGCRKLVTGCRCLHAPAPKARHPEPPSTGPGGVIVILVIILAGYAIAGVLTFAVLVSVLVRAIL